ncbi:MAG: hypothetical protein ACTSYU_04785 [Promethearchaeota archaeon]
MKKWKINLKIGENSEEIIELFDIKEVLEGYLNINRNFYDELLGIVKILNRYMIGKGIESVLDPKGNDWSKNPWILLMVKDTENDTPFRFLMKREKDLSGYLVGIGPEKFFDYLKSTKEEEEEIKRFLEYLIAYPQKFKISMIIPNFIQ